MPVPQAAGLFYDLFLPLAKYVPTRAELSSLKLCRVQPDLSKERKGAKITRADVNCRSNGAELRWSLKDAKAGAIPLRDLSPATLA